MTPKRGCRVALVTNRCLSITPEIENKIARDEHMYSGFPIVIRRRTWAVCDYRDVFMDRRRHHINTDRRWDGILLWRARKSYSFRTERHTVARWIKGKKLLVQTCNKLALAWSSWLNLISGRWAVTVALQSLSYAGPISFYVGNMSGGWTCLRLTADRFQFI